MEKTHIFYMGIYLTFKCRVPASLPAVFPKIFSSLNLVYLNWPCFVCIFPDPKKRQDTFLSFPQIWLMHPI